MQLTGKVSSDKKLVFTHAATKNLDVLLETAQSHQIPVAIGDSLVECRSAVALCPQSLLIVLELALLTPESLLELASIHHKVPVGLVGLRSAADMLALADRMAAPQDAPGDEECDLTIFADAVPRMFGRHRIENGLDRGTGTTSLVRQEWGCLSVSGHGEPIDVVLGGMALCGRSSSPLMADGRHRTHTCLADRQTCTRAAEGHVVVPVEELRTGLLFVETCTGIAAGGLYPDELSLAFNAYFSGCRAVISTVRAVRAIPHLVFLVRALARGGMRFGQLVQILNLIAKRASSCDDGRSAYLLIGDPEGALAPQNHALQLHETLFAAQERNDGELLRIAVRCFAVFVSIACGGTFDACHEQAADFELYTAAFRDQHGRWTLIIFSTDCIPEGGVRVWRDDLCDFRHALTYLARRANADAHFLTLVATEIPKALSGRDDRRDLKAVGVNLGSEAWDRAQTVAKLDELSLSNRRKSQKGEADQVVSARTAQLQRTIQYLETGDAQIAQWIDGFGAHNHFTPKFASFLILAEQEDVPCLCPICATPSEYYVYEYRGHQEMRRRVLSCPRCKTVSDVPDQWSDIAVLGRELLTPGESGDFRVSGGWESPREFNRISRTLSMNVSVASRLSSGGFSVQRAESLSVVSSRWSCSFAVTPRAGTLPGVYFLHVTAVSLGAIGFGFCPIHVLPTSQRALHHCLCNELDPTSEAFGSGLRR